MAVNSISSSAGAAQQLKADQLRQANQGGQVNQAKQSAEPKKAKEVEGNNPQPQPVVNAQGQTTGKIVNITA